MLTCVNCGKEIRQAVGRNEFTVARNYPQTQWYKHIESDLWGCQSFPSGISIRMPDGSYRAALAPEGTKWIGPLPTETPIAMTPIAETQKAAPTAPVITIVLPEVFGRKFRNASG